MTHPLCLSKLLIAALLLVMQLGPIPARAQELSAFAQFQPELSALTETDQSLDVTLALSQPVPWRVRLLDNPPRVVFDFREVDWSGLSRMPISSDTVQAVRAGTFRPGWSRLVLELSHPMVVARAAMQTEGNTVVQVQLLPASEAAFAAKAALPEPPGWTLPKPADLPKLVGWLRSDDEGYACWGVLGCIQLGKQAVTDAAD